MNVAYLKVKQAIIFFFFFFFFGSGFLKSFHRHSCPSIMIICIQPRAVAGAEAGMARRFFFWAAKKQLGVSSKKTRGVGALRKLRTLRIGSGGNLVH